MRPDAQISFSRAAEHLDHQTELNYW